MSSALPSTPETYPPHPPAPTSPTRRYCELYDLAVTLAEDLPLYLDLLSDRVHHVVEIGCGTGRIALPLARRGHRVTGTDIAPAMVEVALAKLQREPDAVRERADFRVGDMLDVSLPPGIDTFLVPYNVLKYLTTRAAQLRFLAACALPSGGRLLLHCDVDRFDPASLPLGQRLPLFTDRLNPETGHKVSSFHIIHRVDAAEDGPTITAEALYLETLASGQQVVHAFTGRMRLLRDPFAVVELCRAAGLEVIHAWGDFDRSPLVADAPRVIVEAEKRPPELR